tara:strand:- start:18 stop:536 length:519 start_codon:yes stop_codon:yes gene_type:complete
MKQKIKNKIVKEVKQIIYGLLLIVFGFFLFLVFITQMFPVDVQNFFLNTQYKFVSSYEENHTYINNLAELCNFEKSRDQVECVVTNLNHHYNYSLENRISSKKLQTTNEFLNHPSICRDAAIISDKVFRKLGWSNNFIFVPNHVYLQISKSKNGSLFYCNVDLPNYNCRRSK